MAKTWWWRILTVIVFLGGITVGYIIFYPYEYGICNSSGGYCIFSSLKKTVAEPLFLFSAISSIISIFLFFINDLLFLKWLRFAGIWIIISVFVLALLPDRTEGLFSFGGPDKETVSIYLGALFVILSLAKIVWDWKKEKRLN